MAALQVVYRRLEECGLGDFCLQIHGLKTGKKELLNSVETRMNRQARLPDNFGQTRLLLKKAHKDLVDTSRALAVPAGPEELPLHDIVWRVERLRQRLPNDCMPVEIPDLASLSSSAFLHARQRLEDLGREWAARRDRRVVGSGGARRHGRRAGPARRICRRSCRGGTSCG